MIRTFVFSQGKLINRDLSPDLLHLILYDDNVQLWVDMEKSTPEENKAVLETVFGFHPLAIDDCIAVTERPKIDDYESYVFFVVHAVDYSSNLHGFQTTELNVFVGKNYIVTFHNDPLRSIDATCERIQKKGHALPRWADLLAYQILDLLLDNYQPALDELSAELSALERLILIGATRDVVTEVVNLQNEVQRLRKIIAPQRDVIARMIHGEFPKVIRSQLIPYLRDLQDNLSRISDLADAYRETIASALQVHLNLQQMQINRVIKVLTILATLSMPILLVTSFYGMNIRHMPNTEWPSWPWAYAYILGLNVFLIGVLFLFMKRHKWL